MYIYLILQGVGVILLSVGITILLIRRGFWRWLKKELKPVRRRDWMGVGVFVVGAGLLTVGSQSYSIHFAMPANMHSQTPDKNPPSLPILSALNFIKETSQFERISDISADPNDVPIPINRPGGENVKLSLTTQEVISEVAPGVYNNYWTFDGQVPGPMLRVKVNDNIEMSITNHKSSIHNHNIDLHSVTGPGGGAELTNVEPGQTKAFKWKALQPGLYIYHCATSNVSVHNSHGQYGLILVEPEGGLSKVDKEFYVVQGELYTQGGIGAKGLVMFDPKSLLDGNPSYVTFNGKVQSENRMKVNVGDTVRMYVGNGGVNLVSSFHIIGEIFDTVYPEAAIGPKSTILQNVQTTAVLPGGATIVEFKADVPGKYLLVDHALARMNKGAWATLEVIGNDKPSIFTPVGTDSSKNNAHSH